MTSSATLFATGMYVFASICVAAVCIMAVLWVGLKFEEAWEWWLERRRLKKQVIKYRRKK